MAPQQAINATITDIALRQNDSTKPWFSHAIESAIRATWTTSLCGYELSRRDYLRSLNPIRYVPIAALLQHQEQQDNYYVWVKNNRAHKVNVTLGVANDTQQAVLSGLQQGDLVVTGHGRALYSIRNTPNDSQFNGIIMNKPVLTLQDISKVYELGDEQFFALNGVNCLFLKTVTTQLSDRQAQANQPW